MSSDSAQSRCWENIERYFGSTIENMIANLSTAEDEVSADISNEIADLQAWHVNRPLSTWLISLSTRRSRKAPATSTSNRSIVNSRYVTALMVCCRKCHSPETSAISDYFAYKIMSEMDIAERYTPQDGHIRMTINAREFDFRVSTIPTVHGESVVMRILDKSNILIEIKQLGFLPDTEKIFMRLLHRSNGILLVTGPTGSGKTTTLYAALNRIKNPNLKSSR